MVVMPQDNNSDRISTSKRTVIGLTASVKAHRALPMDTISEERRRCLTEIKHSQTEKIQSNYTPPLVNKKRLTENLKDF